MWLPGAAALNIRERVFERVVPVTRLLLLDHDVLFRETLTRLLQTEPDLAVVAQCGTKHEALEALSRSPVEMVLMELAAASDSGYEFLSACRSQGYAGKILAVTEGLAASASVKALRLGAAGIFLKSRGLETLLTAIRRVAAGEAWLEPEVIRVLAAGAEDTITDREQQVLRGVLDGLTNRQIAERLLLPESTVKACVRRLFRKAGARTRGQLIRSALAGPGTIHGPGI